MSALLAWALQVLHHDVSPDLEDVEMASAVVDREFDEQMGTAGGPAFGLVPIFPNGRPREPWPDAGELGGIDWE